MAFINLNQVGSSYVHISDFNPMPDQPVDFTVYVLDPDGKEIVNLWWSRDNRQVWHDQYMVFDPLVGSYNTQLGGFPPQTRVFYYVEASRGSVTIRSPASFDFLVWDNPPTVDVEDAPFISSSLVRGVVEDAKVTTKSMLNALGRTANQAFSFFLTWVGENLFLVGGTASLLLLGLLYARRAR